MKKSQIAMLILIPWLSGSCAFLSLGPQNPYRFRGGPAAPDEDSDEAASVPRLGDVSAGMSMKDVLGAWGEPRHVQYAGQPSSGNQRWVYTGAPSGLGKEDSRVLYFEGGQLVGWRSGEP